MYHLLCKGPNKTFSNGIQESILHMFSCAIDFSNTALINLKIVGMMKGYNFMHMCCTITQCYTSKPWLIGCIHPCLAFDFFNGYPPLRFMVIHVFSFPPHSSLN